MFSKVKPWVLRMNGTFNTPIAFILFNRPIHTARVLQAIRQVHPKRLFLIADGPRVHKAGESTLCRKTRKAVEEAIDWDCQVHHNYSQENLGCRQRIASGLHWVFEHTERAIILEDDCLPHPAFFHFCAELLDAYADDESIMSISGNNFVGKKRCPEASYYYSQYMHCWGWATWRRAWQHYDDTMKDWPERDKENWLKKFTFSRGGYNKWKSYFDQVYNRQLDTWDFVWTYSIWACNGWNILPDRNLVSNIGFDAAGTHTQKSNSQRSNVPVHSMSFPLCHPRERKLNKKADVATERFLFGGSHLLKPLYQLGKSIHKRTNVLKDILR